ncbi:MAG: NAD(P)H-dependent oxidoreductase [Melioribacteraceae bacterium]|nr:NAD(P)H-dependent oxidoreductase [Melioribacteraceae bacterium]MCF8263792.1 NAD(P)H-dependent oxidoreductase [Melioribacteraceae bacterium]MCF8412363.1 NAD(P)H-dependent oxidoreductase [Melioribacteraceae bacterium]MCF8430775.1 NAD(P)H-dependent oxidoreductase [Melioribacteraceae bacterium]
MKKILILFAHPALEKSRVNRILIKELQKTERVTFHDLYESYPNFEIDVKYEQKLLLANDIVVFMHPMFWYSTPAILKEWQDLVLEHRWAYGREGDKLKGKYFVNFVSTGGKKDAYQSGGFNQHTIRQFLLPIEQTAKLCKMYFLPPFTISGTHSIEKAEVEKHKERIHKLIHYLQNDSLDIEETKELDTLNELFEKLVKE